MLIAGEICKAASRSQSGLGGNRILVVGDRFIAGEYAKLLIAFKRVSVETESHWLETCLLQEKMQSCKLLQRFRCKPNLTGLRHALLQENMQGG